MIPKVIHYCWFGRAKYPPIVEKCINSWRKYCSSTDKTYAIYWRSNLWGKFMDRIKAKLRIRLGIVRTNKIKNILKKRDLDLMMIENGPPVQPGRSIFGSIGC